MIILVFGFVVAVLCGLYLRRAGYFHGGMASRIHHIQNRIKFQPSPQASNGKQDILLRRQRTRFAFTIARQAVLIEEINKFQRRLEAASIKTNVANFIFICMLFPAMQVAAVYAIAPEYAKIMLLFSPFITTIGVKMFLDVKIRIRNGRFAREFPDAIDMIVRSIKSGLPIVESMHSVANEMHGVAASIFGEVTGGLKLGLSLDQSLWAASRKIDMPEFGFFATSIIIQQETGGNLVEILVNLVNMIRRREQMKLKIKAMSSEAKASAIIIGSLPFLLFFVIYFINQEYIMKLFVDPRGMMMTAAGLASFSLGIAVMRKMVKFDI